MLILSGFMSTAKCMRGIVSCPFLPFLFLSKEQHRGGWGRGEISTLGAGRHGF